MQKIPQLLPSAAPAPRLMYHIFQWHPVQSPCLPVSKFIRSTSGKVDGKGTAITATGRDTAEIKGFSVTKLRQWLDSKKIPW